MPAKNDQCDTITATMRMMSCWELETDMEKLAPPAALAFISNIASKTKTSQLWNYAAVLGESVSSCNFPVKINKGWTEPVTCRCRPFTESMQIVVHLVISAPTGRRKSSVFNKVMEANAGCEKVLGQSLVTQVRACWCSVCVLIECRT
jgi:hypothetical protein